MVTCPPPYSPAVISPEKDAYSRGWSSVGTASRLVPGSVGGPFGTAQLLRTPSRSSRRSQCTRSPAPRGVRCSWTTKVAPSSVDSRIGSGCPAGGTGSAVRAGSRLARYAASGSAVPWFDPALRRAGTSGAAAGALGRLVGGRRLLGGRLLRGGRLGSGRLLRGRRLLHRRRRGPLRGGGLLRRDPAWRAALVPAAGALHARSQRAHQVD